MIISPVSFNLEVDYDDPQNWNIDSGFLNRHPLIHRERFPISCQGKAAVCFRTIEVRVADGMQTTQEIIDCVRQFSGIRHPNLAETRVYHRENCVFWKSGPIVSMCGALHEQGGVPFIAYVQGTGADFNLFYNWMAFTRRPPFTILVVEK